MLTTLFQSLDPLDLQRQIQALQEQLWQYADTRSRRPQKLPALQPSILQSTPECPAETKPSFTENELTPPARFYRRTKRKITHSRPRYWRTRTDPFADVWQEVEQHLHLSPQTSAKSLFLALQQQYPDKFTDGQLRTLQRRVKSWRLEQADGIDVQEEEPSTTLGDRQ